MLFAAIESILTRLEIARNILAYEEMAASAMPFAREAIAVWETMLRNMR